MLMSAAGFLPAGAAGADLNGAFKTETMGLSINPSDAQFVAPPRDLAFVPEEESQQTESDGDGFDLEDDGEVGEGDQLRTQRGDPKNPIKAFPCLTNHFDDGPVAAVKDEGSPHHSPSKHKGFIAAGTPSSILGGPRIRARNANDITLEDLSKWFHVPSEQAAKKLGIGLTVLKRQCRKFGIRRWPFRKLKSLDRLMENIQTSVAPPEQNLRYVKSVEELETQKRRMEMGLELELDEDTKRLQQAYSKANHKLRQQLRARGEGLSSSGRNTGTTSPGGGMRNSPHGMTSEQANKLEEAVANLDPEQAKHAQHLIEQCMASMPTCNEDSPESGKQVEQFSMALAAMLAFAQQGSNGSAGDQGRGTPAGRGSPGSQHRSHRYRLEDERYHPPEVLQASNTCGLLDDREGEVPEGRSSPQGELKWQNRDKWQQGFVKRPWNEPGGGLTIAADPLSSLADLAEQQGYEDPHDAAEEEQLDEVEVLARLQIYAQEMGYLLQSTAVLPLPSGRRRGVSNTVRPPKRSRR